MIPILMYHQVADVPGKLDPLGLAMPPYQFDQQMAALARKGYKCLTLHEAVRIICEHRREPPQSFVLTFDDGYKNVLTNACPILEKYGFTATVFLVASQLGSTSSWWGQDGDYSGLLMTREEALEVSRRGFILGSHSLNHLFLNRLDAQAAFREIQNSKIQLEDQLDMQVDYFSYPFSETDSRIEKLVESAGYIAACAGDSGSWGVYHLWRIPCVRSDSMLLFTMKANGMYNYRTALRESAPGLLLRRGVRTIRHKLFPHRSHCRFDPGQTGDEKTRGEV